jgi:protein SCO1/2
MQSVSPVAGKPHLLTVSFDTENDTPEVLRKYGRRYMNPAAFEEWEFATGSPEEIKEITSYFGLSYLKESGQIIHSLVTALIGPNGKLVRLYLGNEWTSSQILAEFR